MNHIFFIHASVDGHLDCFHVQLNSAARTIGVRVSFRMRVFVFSGCISRDGIAGSYENSTFSFLRNLHNSYSILHSHHQCRRVKERTLKFRI